MFTSFLVGLVLFLILLRFLLLSIPLLSEKKRNGTEKEHEHGQDGIPSFPLIRMAVLLLLLFLMRSLPFP